MSDDVAGDEVSRLDRFINNPLPVLQLCCSAMLILSFAASLLAWTFGVADLKIPLLLLGLSVIALGVALNKGAAAVTLSILIIGVLVAPREYLLKIAHMVSGADASFETYARKYEGEQVASAVNVPDEIVKRVLKTLVDQGVDITPTIQKQLNIVVSEEAIDVVVRRVRLEDAFFPLMQVIEGGEVLQEFIAEYREYPELGQDMNFLRNEGLVEFTGRRFDEAIPTEFGRRVAAAEERTFRGDGIDILDNLPSVGEMTSIVVGAAAVESALTDDAPVQWFRFVIEAEGVHRISVKSSGNADPYIQLFGPDSFDHITEDDDSGGNYDSLIEWPLKQGEFYLAVEGLGGLSGPISVSVSTVILDE